MVWRIIGLIVFLLMASKAGGGRVVIPAMTIVARISDGGMSTLKHVIIVMIGHGCRHPDRLRMTRRTI